MNRQWMRDQLEAFDDLALRYERSRPPGGYLGDETLRRQLYMAEPTARQILIRLDARLADELDLDRMAGEAMARTLVHRAIGILDGMDDWGTNLAPDAPTLPANQFHPWVWEAARTFWESRHYRAAVNAAATAINSHTQTKIGRRDIFDVDLMNQVLKPSSNKAYLQLPGDPSDRTLQSRNNALRPFAEGCFAGIRNPAAHEHEPDWDQQTALEYLATLSVLARWIDDCVLHYND